MVAAVDPSNVIYASGAILVVALVVAAVLWVMGKDPDA